MNPSEIYANGYNPKRLEALKRHFERLVGDEFVHCAAWAIMHKGKLISHGSMGSRSAIDHSLPMLPETYFRIASMTKIFTTTAIMMLVEDGVLRLDAWAKEYVEEFPHNGVTLWHLLTHTSGMYPDWGTYPDIEEKQFWHFLNTLDYENIDPQTFDWLGNTCPKELFREIGAEWLYCTFGFVVLGEIISRVSGMNVHEFITEKIIKPCGLTNTFWKHTPETVDKTFIWGEEHKARFDKIKNGTDKIFDSVKEENEYKLHERIPSTGGGLTSTVTDMAKFCEMFLNYGKTESGEHIISRKAVEMMTT
jgi:CubicO group peptidase (beta-lactamase class C family)